MRHAPIGEQVIVVFGASSGIGRATALAAARRGARVFAAGRDIEALRSLESEVGGAPDAAPRLAFGVADVADVDQVQAIAEQAVATFGRMDTWAHVAGVGEYAPFESVTPAEFRRVVDVTLLGPVWGARAAIPHLRASRGAYVVVSSEVAKRGFPLLTAYSAAKHGVDGFVEALRVELQHDRSGVTVTQILPAAVSTPFFEHARSRLGVRGSGPPPVYPPERIADAILRAAERGGDVAVGAFTRSQLALQRLSPRILDGFSRSVAFRAQRSDEPRDPADDALFEPPAGDDRVRGVVTTTHR